MVKGYKQQWLYCIVMIFGALANLTAQMPAPQSSHSDKAPAVPIQAEGRASNQVSYKIIPAVNHTWGYDIFLNNQLFIHQTTVPAMPGNEGFTTRENAVLVADFVVAKIKKGEMPPRVTLDDLKKLTAN
ncbi:MAG: DUF4907 domain-containing protein [Chitinophagales bacterium]